MCRNSLFLGGLACLLLSAPLARAETPASPLRLIPAEADFLLQIKSPRQVHDLLLGLELVKEVQKLPNTREFFNSTQARRFFQLLAYFERELGAKYPDLLEQLSGGVALGVKFGPDPAPLLVAIQGKDEKLTRKFTDLAVKILEQELQRQEAKAKPEKISYQGIEVVRFGNDFYLAGHGATLLLANREEALHRGLDLAQGKGGKSLADVETVKEAARLLPPNALVSGWLNMETVRKAPGADAIYKTPRDPGLTVLFGSYLDVLGRAPYVCFGVTPTPEGATTTIRIPRGRDGMGPELALHMPPDPAAPGTRPLLQPKGVLLSDSDYLDLARIWEDRQKLFGEDVVKGLEDFNKNAGKVAFLPGLQISKLLPAAGPYLRTVVVNQPKAGYKSQPRISIPAFAFVIEMRDPATFGKTMEVALRGAAFFAGNQAGLKLAEEKYKDVNVVGYRFPEDKPLRQDVNDIRFNFSPCFATVGNQFVICSTIELGKELVDLLQVEQSKPPQVQKATARTRIYSGGIAAILQLFEDQLVTQAILDQALPAQEARQQVKDFIELLRKQGTLNLETNYSDKETSYTISVRKAAPTRTRD